MSEIYHEENDCEFYTDKQINDFEEISFSESFTDNYKSYKRAAHGMIFAKTSTILFGKYTSRAAVMMQMRFDGTIGFVGGLVDKTDETVVDALNREFLEEINMKRSAAQFHQNGHLLTHVHHVSELILHFYLKEIDLESFLQLERDALQAEHFGIETLGIMRVPCYVWADGRRGLPTFLRNRFAGKAKQQLLMGLVRAGIFSGTEIDQIVQLSNDIH